MTDTTDTVTSDAASPAPAVTPAAPTKPGHKTTEFALTVIANAIGALVYCGVIPAGGEPAKLAGAALMLLATLGYTFQRTKLKSDSVAMLAVLLLALGTVSASTGCATRDARKDTIHATFVATSTAADAFATYSAQHQIDLVAAAKAAGKTKDEARAELDAFRVKRDHVIELLVGVLRAASIADRVNNDQSTSTLFSAALQFHAALSDATGGKIQ